ncbi:uncharacterized protein LOC123918715 isoform X4 [Trifolium pratense]|uniref:uncharacterized protein LOC123918715 isoform X4 n=1 Tax=Trifolium pratense TaxID=57577 RepID=UPI001E6971C8|nr:uncharacterized protein LOC123918715 isoform X4 [Trifolium pratense]
MELTLLLTQLLRLDVNNFLKEDPTSFDKETREGKSLWCLWALSQTQEGLLLLEELVNSFDGEGFLAIIDASKQWFNESQVIKVECNASWWRKFMKEHKNHKVRSEGILWMVSAVVDFGVSHLKLKDCIDFVKEIGLQSSAAATRNASIKLLGVLHKFVVPGSIYSA